MDLQAFQDSLARATFGMTKDEALRNGICIRCKKVATDVVHSKLGWEEYENSALCESCFDGIIKAVS